MTRIALTRIQASLDIEGYRRVPISAFVTNFAKNQVPTAVCTLGAGIEVTGLGSGIDKETLTRLESRDTILRIVALFSGEAHPGVSWPTGEIVLFEGRSAGVSDVRVRDRAEYVVQISHWLNDLSKSALLMPFSYPTNYTSLALPGAQSRMKGVGSVDAGADPASQEQAAVAAPDNSIYFDAEFRVDDDIWLSVKRMLLGVMDGQVKQHPDFPIKLDNLLQLDRKGIAALRRIDGKADEESRDYSAYGVPLRLSSDELLVDNSILNEIKVRLTSIGSRQFSQLNCWSYLVGLLCARHSLMVVPMVDHAMIVPDTPSLRTTYRRELRLDDIVQRDRMVLRKSQDRAVVVATISQNPVDSRGTSDKLAFATAFVPQPDNLDGLVRVVAAPPWADGVLFNQDDPQKSAGEPAAGTGGSDDADTAGSDEKTVRVAELNAYMERYAQTVYHATRMAENRLKVVTRPRWDIAPGSIVKIAGSPIPSARAPTTDNPELDQLITEATAIIGSVDYVGQVERVTISVDVESKSAFTTFQIGFLRNTTQNADDRYSINRHPLFPLNTPGSPLIDELDLDTV